MAEDNRLRHSAVILGGFIALLWNLRAADAFLDLNLYRFGILPRHLEGLWGILWAPLVHGNWGHVFANSVPLFVLGVTLLYGYPQVAWRVVAGIWLGSGLGVWLFARASYHLGASGLTHGLMFFIFVSGILRRDRSSIALAMIVFFLYGGMVWTIFPQKPEISFESHFFGAVMGVALAFLLGRQEAPPPDKRYAWEEDPDDPVIGDQWRLPSNDAESGGEEGGAPR